MGTKLSNILDNTLKMCTLNLPIPSHFIYFGVIGLIELF